MGSSNGTANRLKGDLVSRRNQSVTLDEARALTPAPRGLGTWAEKLREAALSAVTQEDVRAIVSTQVGKARGGDAAAAKFVLGFLAGAAPKVVVERPGPRRALAEPADGPARPAAVAPGVAPGVKALRRLAAHVIHSGGPTPAPALILVLELNGTAELEAVLDCDWFAPADGGWSLTPEGRQAVA